MLKQQSFTGRVLPSTTADIPCSKLCVDEILESLNITFAPVNITDSLCKACQYFIDKKYDLGTAYAHLRCYTYGFNFDEHITEACKSDEQERNNLLTRKTEILWDGTVPRRVWDLYANRVVQFWIAKKLPWAISHAWVDEKDRKYEMTPINGYEWSVPMPKGANLDLIRIEMLNLGAEYVWLDVLCLRQRCPECDPRDWTLPTNLEQWRLMWARRKEDKENQDGCMGHAVPWYLPALDKMRKDFGHREALDNVMWRCREALRKEEWKLDVPTIGGVYVMHSASIPKVVYYLSGLGLPLSFKTPADFEDDRCWFNRVWTLQEIHHHPLIAGMTREGSILGDNFDE